MSESKIKQRIIQVREFPVFSMESLKWIMGLLTFLGVAFGVLWTWQDRQDDATMAVGRKVNHNATILEEHVKQSEKTFDGIHETLKEQKQVTDRTKEALIGVQKELEFIRRSNGHSGGPLDLPLVVIPPDEPLSQ